MPTRKSRRNRHNNPNWVKQDNLEQMRKEGERLQEEMWLAYQQDSKDARILQGQIVGTKSEVKNLEGLIVARADELHDLRRERKPIARAHAKNRIFQNFKQFCTEAVSDFQEGRNYQAAPQNGELTFSHVVFQFVKLYRSLFISSMRPVESINRAKNAIKSIFPEIEKYKEPFDEVVSALGDYVSDLNNQDAKGFLKLLSKQEGFSHIQRPHDERIAEDECLMMKRYLLLRLKGATTFNQVQNIANEVQNLFQVDNVLKEVNPLLDQNTLNAMNLEIDTKFEGLQILHKELRLRREELKDSQSKIGAIFARHPSIQEELLQEAASNQKPSSNPGVLGSVAQGIYNLLGGRGGNQVR